MFNHRKFLNKVRLHVYMEIYVAIENEEKSVFTVMEEH